MAMTREEYEQIVRTEVANKNASNVGFRLVLTPHFRQTQDMTEDEHDYIDRLNRPVEFDFVENATVSSSSDLTRYPTVNKETVSDHIIRQPDTMSINGAFSLYGNKKTNFEGSDDRLTNLQNFFEKLKNEGIMCTITTLDRTSNNKTRFKVRNNMVLKNITWTQGQASVGFSFSFEEALVADMLELTVDYTDENIPVQTDPNTLNFTDEFVDPKEISNIVLNQLHEVGLLTDEFSAWISENESTIRAIAIGAGVVAIVVGAKVLGIMLTAAATSLAASGPVGWIILAAAAVITAISAGIIAICNLASLKKVEKEYGIKAFKRDKNDAKNTSEAERLCKYLGTVNQRLESLNQYMQVFAIKANVEQQCMLCIDNDYYLFTFTKNNTQTEDGKFVWKLTVESMNEENDQALVDIADITNSALKSIDECTQSNHILNVDDLVRVYLFNNKLYAVENASYNSEEEQEKAIQDCKSDLTNYIILATQTDMTDFAKKLRKLTLEAMKA